MDSKTAARRRYFDNAATSFPKPPAVAQAVADYLRNIGASAGRGVYREALQSRQILDDCRAALRQLFNCRPEDEVIFTLNGTDALNLAIKGLVRAGAHVVTTALDHNSVLRPLSALQEQAAIRWTATPVDPVSTLLDPDDIAREIRDDTRLVVINHASNVTGVLQDIAPLASLCRSRGIPLLLDAAQSAGHVPIDFSGLGLDLLACPGHKGLLGPLGTGILIIRAGLADQLQTWREGGTGSESERPVQPATGPDKFEAGSHNAPGIAGLLAGVRWVLSRGVENLRQHELHLCRRMIDGLRQIRGLRFFGPHQAQQRVGVFSVRVEGLTPEELSAALEERFGILTRSGLHCAPLAHRTIGTAASGGTTRFSFGPFLEEEDIDTALEALAQLSCLRPGAVRVG
jgi:cysteine desulfurase/selenocysteine lyase